MGDGGKKVGDIGNQRLVLDRGADILGGKQWALHTRMGTQMQHKTEENAQ